MQETRVRFPVRPKSLASQPFPGHRSGISQAEKWYIYHFSQKGKETKNELGSKWKVFFLWLTLILTFDLDLDPDPDLDLDLDLDPDPDLTLTLTLTLILTLDPDPDPDP